ncbi:Chaperone DnaJ-domain superfamily protein [Striga hermonthica]|uniref:Chaperone DnaJ-domain superfamily protein n=1 Tax=Striga hermonthica TaxID=68872 RepID=A0A9N7MHN3_STRHE|nr:Chaperone DnaJ-domain superfamily protein [Striga hermonthica]
MEHPFFTSGTATRAEAIRWLTIAEKLLSTRDLLGSRSFASRARDADPTLSSADDILAVVDTLLAGDRRIGTNHPDFYSILGLAPPQGADAGLVADQYRSLVLRLNPHRNRFPFAEQAYRLVVDAWSILSDPASKALYDKQLGFFQPPHQPDPFAPPLPGYQHNFTFPHPPVHGGENSGIAPTQFAPVHQVLVQPQVGPSVGGPTSEPQNFMGLHSGSNIVFGSMPSHEPVNNPVVNQQNYSSFSSFYVAPPASRTYHEQLIDNNNNNCKEKHSQHDYPVAGENSPPSVCENVEENIENVEQGVEENVESVEHDAEGNLGNVEENVENVEQDERDDYGVNDNELTFWTTCPYCYYMYEYPRTYVDCAMRCQNCKMAFQAVVIPSPPPVPDGQDAYFCCWGFIPLGFSMEDWKRNNYPAPKTGARYRGPWVYIDEDDENDHFVNISSSGESDIDWNDVRTRKGGNNKSAANVKRKATTASGTRIKRSRKVLVQDADNVTAGKKQHGRVAKSFEKLDLNVELRNEAEEPALGANNKENKAGHKEDDHSIEGTGFFEGLDELFSNLPPILNGVADDKVVKAA